MVEEGFAYSAAGFVGVCAVSVTAIGADAEDFRKEMADLVLVKLKGAETLHSGGVDDIAARLDSRA